MKVFHSTLLALFLSSTTPFVQAQVFTDQIPGSGLIAQQARALALYDHDNDGFTDVIWASENFAQVQLMRNNGDLTFTDISATAGFEYLGADLQTLDLDNNGWNDIIQIDGQSNSINLRMNSVGTFTSYTISAPIDVYGAPVFMDHDRNGSVDLVIAVIEANGTRSIGVIYNDVCDANIADALQTFASLAGPFAVGVDPIYSCIDYDNDLDSDLLVVLQGTNNGSPGAGYHYQPINLFSNDAGSFTDVTANSGIELGHASGATIWDYNNDGTLDFTFGTGDCCDNPNVARTYRNNGDGTFTDVSESVVLKSGNNYYDVPNIADFDNDGDEDVYWRQGAWSNSQLFRNEGGTFSTDVASAYGLSLSGGQDNNGAPNGGFPYWFDIDNDGDQDVLFGTQHNSSAKLMINPLLPSSATDTHSLTLDLEGCASGKSAINAVVKVYRTEMVTAQLSSSTLQGGLLRSRYHFGMGSAAIADSVVVLWPSGAITRMYQVPSGHLLIQEDPDCIFTNCLTTAIGPSEKQNSSSAYPNPTTGSIRLTNIPQDTAPQLFDATGRSLAINPQRQGQDAILDLGTYPTGLYFVRAGDRSFTIVRE